MFWFCGFCGFSAAGFLVCDFMVVLGFGFAVLCLLFGLTLWCSLGLVQYGIVLFWVPWVVLLLSDTVVLGYFLGFAGLL